MSEQLRRVIEKVQSEIENNSEAFQREAPTKQSLILPILNALGWDVFDHTRVHPEFPTGSGEVDWALKVKGKPAVLVEAKSLGTQLDANEQFQLSRYCFDLGVPTALLTNGAEWQVYRPLLTAGLGELPFKDRLIIHQRLDRDDAAESANELSRLHYDKLDELDKGDLNVLLNIYWAQYSRSELLKPFSETLRESLIAWCKKPPGEVPSRAVGAWLRTKMFPGRRTALPHNPNDKRLPRKKKPPMKLSAVVIAGEHIPIRYANEVLVHTAEWLVKEAKLNKEDCPVIVGSGDLYLIHREPFQPNGDGFRGEKKLSNGLYVTTHFATPPLIQKSRDLLIQFGYSPDMLQIIEKND